MNLLIWNILAPLMWVFDPASVQAAETQGSANPVTVVAFGDSTTAPRGRLKTYADCLRADLPDRGIQVEIINAGVGGHSTQDAWGRFEQDVTEKHPQIVIVQFGINDSTINVWKNPPDTKAPVSLGQFTVNLERMVETLSKQECQVILMTPNPMRWTPALVKLYGKPPYLPADPDGLNVTLSPYAAAVRALAKKRKLPLIDVHNVFQAYGQKPGQSVDDLLLDGMHPNDQGQRLVADLLIPEILRLRGQPLE